MCLACLGFDPSLRPAPTLAPSAPDESLSARESQLAREIVDRLFESTSDPGTDEPSRTEGERLRLRADAQRSDRALLERWKHDIETATYVEVNGGWLRVDGHRLRLGPREGEVWLSFHELQFVLSERSSRTR